MAQAAPDSVVERNPPIDYAVAVWLGTPEQEIAKGLDEGWIRAPAGVDMRAWTEERGLSMTNRAGEEAPSSIAPPSPDPVPSPMEQSNSGFRSRIEGLLRRIDPALDAATFSAAWEEAGSDDGVRAARFASFLGRALNASPDTFADVTAQLDAVEASAPVHSTSARFVRIAAMSTQALEQLAAADGGFRRALAEHAPWAFSGDRSLERSEDVAGRYDRFDANTGEQLLSDAWVADRAKHAAWRNAQAAGHSLAIESDGWRFVDRAAGDALNVELEGGSGGPVHQVIFARDDGDSVTGGAGTDRVHGGRSDDVLRGRGGDDLLEGGAGDDFVQGGAGRDVLEGQRGSDELDGGGGDDELAGGGGDDELIGGRGDDRLRGGAGDDTYRFDAGDGTDTVEDDTGVIAIDDVVVSGAMRRSAEGWTSEDGRFRFALEGQGDERTLVIRGPGSTAAGEPNSDVVRIDSWRQGAFGISLEGSGDEELEVTFDDARAGGDTADHAMHGEADQAGNEAPLGASDVPGSPPAPSPDWLSSEPFEALSLVDSAMLSDALDRWSPSGAIAGGHDGDGSTGVTAFDLSDALATASQGESDDGALALSWEARQALQSPSLSADGPRAPPEFALRGSP